MILTFTALGVLHWLSGQPEGDHRVPDEVCPRKYQPGIYDELVQNELLVDERAGGSYTFQISPQAHARVDRAAKHYRQAAIQLWILRSVAANPDRGGVHDHFPPQDVQGEPVSAQEYDRALEHLTSAELIFGMAASGGELIRPKLTARGHEALDSGYAPSDWASRESVGSSSTHYGDSNTMTISAGTVGSAQQGDGNIATVTQAAGPDLEAFASALAGLRGILDSPQLAPETKKAAADQLDLVEETTRNGGSRQRIQSLLHMFGAALPAALAADASRLAADALAAIPL